MDDNKLFETDDFDIITSGRNSAKKSSTSSQSAFDASAIDRDIEENGGLATGTAAKAAQNDMTRVIGEDGSVTRVIGESTPTARPARRPTAARRVPTRKPSEHPTAARSPRASRAPVAKSTERKNADAPTQVIPSVERRSASAENERTRVMSSSEENVIAAARKTPAPAAVRKPAAVKPVKDSNSPSDGGNPGKKPKKSDSKKKKAGDEPDDGKEVVVKDKGGIFSTFSKTIVYIVAVIGVSILISIIGIKFANDVFAFVKDDYETTVVINSGASISEVADVLASSDVISQPLAFRLYAGFKYRKTTLEFAEGIYTLNSNMNYDQIIYAIKAGKTAARKTVKLTFPEGTTVDEMINMLVENNIGTREGYVEAINNYDYDYPFMEELKKISLSPDRKYRLEGYMYPDTYEFYSDSTEIAVVDKFLYNFNSIFGQAEYSRCKELGYNMDEVITVASIVQKESKYASEFYTTASVFYNRLKSSSYPKLESDATVQYCLAEHVEHITAELRNTDSKYNTYLYNGLTPSAICNPGIDAITAALYPEDTDYYFFYAGSDGYNIFAKTLKEHQNNIAKAQKDAQ